MTGGVFDQVVVEIRSAEGGDDAKLLVGELFQIYTKYCRSRGLEIEISDAAESGKGFSRLEFIASGRGAKAAFLKEAGGHRFQRVPPTEKRGRRQTSTVTVAVLPMVSKKEFRIDERDLLWETKRGSGSGGQHRNVTDSAVRLVHLPTKVEVNCQDERSQHRNKEKALEILRARLFALQQSKAAAKENRTRRDQIGSGERGDKIRTYRFQDGRAVDHRTGRKVRLEDVLSGSLDLF